MVKNIQKMQRCLCSGLLLVLLLVAPLKVEADSLAFPPQNTFVLKENQNCPVDQPAACRNSSCPLESSTNSITCAVSSLTSASCDQSSVEESASRYAERLGPAIGENFYDKSKSSQRCIFTPGRREKCHELHDKGKPTEWCGDYEPPQDPQCSASIQLYGICKNAEACGLVAGSCRLILNGIEPEAVYQIDRRQKIQVDGMNALILVSSKFLEGKIEPKNAIEVSDQIAEAVNSRNALKIARIIEELLK